MNESAGLPQADPLSGSAIADLWSFGYDIPDELGGSFVAGELLLRREGDPAAPLRRQFLPRRTGHMEVRVMGRCDLVDRQNEPSASRRTSEGPRIRPAQARPCADRQALRSRPRLAFRRPASVRTRPPSGSTPMLGCFADHMRSSSQAL